MPSSLSLSAVPIRFRRWAVALAAGLVVLTMAVWPWHRRSAPASDPLLASPVLALDSLKGRSLYFNAVGRAWLAAQRPDLLTAEDRDPRSARSRAFGQAVLEPRLFRQLDRRYRFDALLLAGDPNQYRPLLEHLDTTKDFTLEYVDHASVVFRRGAGAPWSPELLLPMRTRLAGRPAAVRAAALALTAEKLAALRRLPESKALLDEALKLEPQSPEVWSGLALYQLEKGNWTECRQASDRALALDQRQFGALATKTQALYATKHFSEAYSLSQQLIAQFPEEPNLLFKHAEIAHQAHAYKAEIKVLEKLIALAETDHRSTTGYRLYLAQACTAAGQGQPAIEQFSRVLADPELPPDQRKFAEESVQRIKSRTGL